jgi:ABC-type transporter Mla subunit MlaD
MAKQRSALKAGLFIIVSIALIFIIVVAVKSGSNVFSPKKHYTVTFSFKDDIGGLRKGDDVRIGGLKVGIVDHVEIGSRPLVESPAATHPSDAQTEPAIIVSFSLADEKKFALRDDAVVGIQGTMMGQSWLNFENLGQRGGVLTESGSLRGVPSDLKIAMTALRGIGPKLEQTVAEARQALADVRTTTVPLVNDTLGKYGKAAETFTKTGETFQETARTGTSLITELKSYLKPVFDKYYAVADSVSKMMGQAGNLFGETTADFKGMASNLNQATGKINTKLPEWFTHVDDLLKRMNTAVADAGDAIKDVKKTMQTANSVVSGNKGTLDSMIKHLHNTALNLELGTAEIKNRPWRLLYSPKKKEVENLTLLDAARAFADGASELNDAAQALRDSANDPHADPAKVEKLSKQLDETFKKFTDVEKKLWDGVKE